MSAICSLNLDVGYSQLRSQIVARLRPTREFQMGKILYGDSGVEIIFDDRAMAHLQLVIGAKLRRGEGFFFSWKDDPSVGDGRSSVWLDAGIPLCRRRENPDVELWLEGLGLRDLFDKYFAGDRAARQRQVVLVEVVHSLALDTERTIARAARMNIDAVLRLAGSAYLVGV